jgi:transposase-like protein
VPILVIIERGGNVIAIAVSDAKQKTLVPIIRENVKKGSNVYTDEYPAYNVLGK